MFKINKNYLELQESYLFSTIAKKVAEYKKNNPDKNVISLGIGDVVLPLTEPVIKELSVNIQDRIKEVVKKTTELEIKEINIKIKDIDVAKVPQND